MSEEHHETHHGPSSRRGPPPSPWWPVRWRSPRRPGATTPAGSTAGNDRVDLVHPRAPQGTATRYFPLAGNGGYDAQHYDLRLGYDPGERDPRRAAPMMTARATQNLSRFDLDLAGLTVRS